LAKYQVKELMEAMTSDELSSTANISQLKTDLAKHYNDQSFLKCEKMGEVVQACLDTLHYH
jgi:hypothetical protein